MIRKRIKRERVSDGRDWNTREAAAGFPGRPIGVRTFKQGGRRRFVADFREPGDDDWTEPTELSRLRQLRRRFSKRMAQLRSGGHVSPFELEMIEALLTGTSQAAFARAKGMERQVITWHINHVMPRAPFFRTAWRHLKQWRALLRSIAQAHLADS
jgi:hypothetical protein